MQGRAQIPRRVGELLRARAGRDAPRHVYMPPCGARLRRGGGGARRHEACKKWSLLAPYVLPVTQN
eukprot:4721764-Prymnesium_polylepis.1